MRCRIRAPRRGRPLPWRIGARCTLCSLAISAPARASQNCWRRWRAQLWPLCLGARRSPGADQWTNSEPAPLLLGLADRVGFPGWIDQPAASALCAAGDILVLPSHAEGLAMSVLEGLAHGLAVVATPVGAHAEVIEPELSGLLAPPGDVAALAAALTRVIGDPALRERLRAGARQRFLDCYDVRSYAVRLARLHVGLLRDRSPLGGIKAARLS